MKRLLTERNLVAILFVLVLITFSFAQNETKKMEQQYGLQSSIPAPVLKFEASVNLGAITQIVSSASKY
jgi:hypothetical protein